MKKSLILASVVAFVATFFCGAVNSFADSVVPGAYARQDQSVMGVGRTIMQMGATDRAHTNALDRASGAARQQSAGSHGESFYQFGSSQTDLSWIEADVRGLVAGDCQGDNSNGVYRKQMNQSRDGYPVEKLVSNAQCAEDHATIQMPAVQ